MDDGEVRCPSRIVGIVRGDVFEVKCRSRTCGAAAGVVVLHDFSLKTGELLHTRKFQDPSKIFDKKEGNT